MKSERRHELQTNELADWVGKRLEAYGPHLKTAGAVVLAIAALGLAYVVVSQRQTAAAGQSWEAYFRALLLREPEEMGATLEKVAVSEGATLPGLWARQTEADVDLENGSRKLFRDRDEALSDLARAEKNYLEVEKTATAYPELLERCRYGLAQAYECQGKLDKAREKYEEVVKADPNGAIGKMAAKRAKLVGNERVAEFYDWFQRQTPPPPGKPPGMGLPPLDMDTLPDRPDLSLGSDKLFGGDTKKPTEEKPAEEGDKPTDKPAEEPGEKPAEKPADKPAEEKPAAEKPTEDKPADKTAANADEKPADEKPAEKPAAKADEKPGDEKPAEKPAEKPSETKPDQP